MAGGIPVRAWKLLFSFVPFQSWWYHMPKNLSQPLPKSINITATRWVHLSFDLCASSLDNCHINLLCTFVSFRLHPLGDHRAASAQSGEVLRSRGGPLERAAARVCREAGARVHHPHPTWQTSTSNMSSTSMIGASKSSRRASIKTVCAWKLPSKTAVYQWAFMRPKRCEGKKKKTACPFGVGLNWQSTPL